MEKTQVSEINKKTDALEDEEAKKNAILQEFYTKVYDCPYENIFEKRTFDGVEYEVCFHKQPVSLGFRTDYYAPFNQTTEIFDGIRYDRDVEVPISEGRKIYIDVYRPEDKLENLPVIMMWTPYGKRHWHGRKETPGLQQAMGVPKNTISDSAVFEGADPLYWCYQGYCVVNVDATGCGYSTGNGSFMTSQGGKDGAEVIDWIGEQSWCNGNVGMAGNSGLAMVQWMIAAAKPKSLKCIAPWEGTSDLYRESLCVGGIPAPAFANMIFWDFRGPGLMEDPGYMIKKYPLMNEYWKDKEIKLENIKIPVYACAGYSHFHLRGSMEGFRRIKSKKKWLRMHRDFEWPDFNKPENIKDLQLFFDRYLKGIHNGWEMTPKVRVEVMDSYDLDYCTNRPELEFPIPRTEFKKYYLDASNMSLNDSPVSIESNVSYNSVGEDISFDIKFNEETELTGNFVLKLWVSAETDDADIFCLVQKLDLDGNFLPTTVFGVADPGAQGRLRVSMRELDEEKSKEYLPKYKFTKQQKLSKGEIVPIEIEIWPHSRIWHKGESLRVNIAGYAIRDKSWFLPTFVDSINEGKHTIHTGGKYDSYLLVPHIPPKHKSGDFEVRDK